MTKPTGIETVLHESRVFPPVDASKVGFDRWLVGSMDEYRAMHKRSLEDPEGFWAEAAQELHWFKPWDRVMQGEMPDVQWFVGGKTNLCYNCVDRHVADGYGDQPAIIWEGEPVSDAGPETKHLSYAELQKRVAQLAEALEQLGVAKGDVVTIYMGMVPELAAAVLACARIGAVHSVIFGGFSAQAIADRVTDANSRVILTCDGAWRRGKVVPLKENVDAAIEQLGANSPVTSVVVLRRTNNDAKMVEGRDHDWSKLVDSQPGVRECQPLDSEHMSFLLYTSGSTGKPKGIAHSIGGYMVFTYLTSKYVFNLQPDQSHVFWCTADVGWITGHSYILYGVMSNRVPTVMYEGGPDYPQPDRFWAMVARHKVTQFYTAPTAIRAFMKWGNEHPAKHDLSSLRVLGSVGEPINPEAWMWYREHIGGNRCPIVDTWWQTETGGHMLTPLPGVTPTKPGSCTLPFFGIDAAIVDEHGNEQPLGSGGLLAIREPWPAMLRGIHGDRERYLQTYWSQLPGMYFPGDGAQRDKDGYFWILGRVDDVINVSGHRLGTMEIESALVSHPAVVEAAVVGVPHEIKGTGIAAFVTLATGQEPGEALVKELREHVAKEIGAIAKPDQIRFGAGLPKTRSGKIMRRLLRDVAAGVENITQDTSTLEDYTVVAKLRENQGGA